MIGVLFGSTRRTAVIALVAVVVVAGGAFAGGVLGAPTVAGVENRFAGVNETTTTVRTDLAVDNPNPVGVSLGGVTAEYAVEMNGVRLAEGAKEGVSVGRGTTNVPFTSHVSNERIPAWWVSHVRNGEHTELTVDATVRSDAVNRSFGAPTVTRDVDTDIISEFNSTETRPVNANRAFVSDPVLYVNRTTAEWGNVTESTTPVRLAFTVYNPKSYPVAVSELGYDVTMNDVDVGEGATESGYVIPPRTAETVETTVRIDNDRIDEWWVTHLERNQRTDLRIEFYANLRAGDGPTVRVPLDALTYTETIETDIFGNKNETGGAGAASPTAAPGEGETTTAAADETETTAGGTTTTGTADGGLLGGGATETTAESAPSDEFATETGTTATETAATAGGLLGDRSPPVPA